MILKKHTIRGKKGKTVCYSIPNIRFDETQNVLKWEAFRFYTPVGNQKDEHGFEYFDVTADEIPIQREKDLDKHLVVKVSRDEGVEAIEVLEGAQHETMTVGLEGDFVINGYIPSDPAIEIAIDYKEVTNG